VSYVTKFGKVDLYEHRTVLSLQRLPAVDSRCSWIAIFWTSTFCSHPF